MLSTFDAFNALGNTRCKCTLFKMVIEVFQVVNKILDLKFNLLIIELQQS